MKMIVVLEENECAEEASQTIENILYSTPFIEDITWELA